MQFRIAVALIVYLASYLPLSFILLCQDFDLGAVSRPFCNLLSDPAARCTLPLEHIAWAVTPVIICAMCLGVSLFALQKAQPKQPISIKEAKAIPADLMNYTLPYVVAFMALDYKDLSKLVGFAVFFLWIFVITYRSGQIILNPVLTVFGWRLYDLSYRFAGGAAEQSGVALSSVALEAGDTVRQTAIQDVLIIKEATRA